MLTTKQLTRIDNTLHPQTVIGWTLTGSSWRQGRRHPGSTVLHLDGGGIVWFPEATSIEHALIEAADRGFKTEDARTKLDHWVKTGEGVRFTLT